MKWIESFLTSRKQRVVVKGAHSEWLPVHSGVPQGSVIGPLLFLVYVNDLLDGIQSSGKLFADDAKLYRRLRNASDSQDLQEDIDQLQEWSQKWLLQFNSEKCKVMHIGKHNPGCEYHMAGETLQTTTGEKDLGIYITPDLKAKTQVAKAAAKANSMLGRIRNSFTFMDSDMLLALYKTLVRPHMEYCIQAWSPYLRKDIDTLEKVQRRATKLVPALRDLPYEERLETLGLTTLENRRVRGDMLETYKILNGYENVDYTQFFQLAPKHGNITTRGHSLKLQKIRYRTQKRGNFFDARIVNK